MKIKKIYFIKGLYEMEIQLEIYTFYERKLMRILYVDRGEIQKRYRIKLTMNEKKNLFFVFLHVLTHPR